MDILLLRSLLLLLVLLLTRSALSCVNFGITSSCSRPRGGPAMSGGSWKRESVGGVQWKQTVSDIKTPGDEK